MAATILFTDSEALEKGLTIFRHQGEAVPTGQPDLYYVSDRTLKALKRERICFKTVDPKQYGLMPVSEAMFTSLRKSLDESRRGKVVRVENPHCLDDILSAGRRD